MAQWRFLLPRQSSYVNRSSCFLLTYQWFQLFADPWYNNNALYVIYHQPPFSKSAGHGNSHETKMKPNGTRVGYADALARECNNPWAAAYARTILQKNRTS